MKEKKSLVLVVDDITSNVEFISDILSTIPNVKIHGLYNGEEAIEYTIENRPDLILLDISMPKMDGFEVCRRLKTNPAYASIPIIFLTARPRKKI
jgi:CheY-like chemotaxis protein